MALDDTGAGLNAAKDPMVFCLFSLPFGILASLQG